MGPSKQNTNQTSIVELLENDKSEATSFDAVTHISYFREKFSFYSLYFDCWDVNLIANNTAMNLRIARLAGKPHVDCCSHKLNLEVEIMTYQYGDLFETIESIQETMVTKKQLKNATLLRNLTHYRA